MVGNIPRWTGWQMQQVLTIVLLCFTVLAVLYVQAQDERITVWVDGAAVLWVGLLS